MMITKKRCIIHEGSGYLKITSERPKRELRKHMEVTEHIKALGELENSVSDEVITYQTNTRSSINARTRGHVSPNHCTT